MILKPTIRGLKKTITIIALHPTPEACNDKNCTIINYAVVYSTY